MLPSLRHRLIITAAAIAGAMIWLLVRESLMSADGGTGLSLFSARVGAVAAMGVILCAGIPVLMLGLVTSTTGNPLSGIFAVAAGLTLLAWRGGPIDGWMRGHDLPGGYLTLMGEVVLWHVGVISLLIIIQALREPMHARFPALAFNEHLGKDVKVTWPTAASLAAAGACAVVGGGLAWTFIKYSASGQVVWSLIIAFTIGAMVAQSMFPQSNPFGVLIGPMVVALIAYGWVLMHYSGHTQVLRAHYEGQLPGIALALPIHYASAGIIGCTLGLGWAQTIDSAPQRNAAAKAASEPGST
jgi:hypothetical protein